MYYSCEYRFRPKGSLRLQEASTLIDMMSLHIGIKTWYLSDGKVLSTSVDDLECVLQHKLDSEVGNRLGIAFSLYSIDPTEKNDETISFSFRVGATADSGFLDRLVYDVSSSLLPENIKLFVGSISATGADEAYILEHQNEVALDTYTMQEIKPFLSQPVIIRPIHYLGERLVESVGGEEFCLKAPAWKVEKLASGVLFQLCEESFSTNNPGHLAIQASVMSYLKI